MDPIYLHYPMQKKIHGAAIANGWRVHRHTGDTDPQRIVSFIEYRRGAKDYVTVDYSYSGDRAHLNRAAAPTRHFRSVDDTISYLCRRFKGAASEPPAAPAASHVVAVWSDPKTFTADEWEDARAYAALQAANGLDLVTVFEWRHGAFMRTAEHNTQQGTRS